MGQQNKIKKEHGDTVSGVKLSDTSVPPRILMTFVRSGELLPIAALPAAVGTCYFILNKIDSYI